MPRTTSRLDERMGSNFRKDPLYAYAQSLSEVCNLILKEDHVDLFDEPKKLYKNPLAKQSMKKFFTENMFDTTNPLYDSVEYEQMQEDAEIQFDNDVEGVYESAAPQEYTPIVGMALPIHKLILMNNVYDKGGIQKVTADKPIFPISLERRILVTPDGTEIDFFLEQNKLTAAIDATNPEKVIELDLPVTEDKDIIADEFGGTTLDNLDVSTVICGVQIEGVTIEAGDPLPDADGYINARGEIATEDTVVDAWFRTNISFKPNYGGPNHYDRAVTYPFVVKVKNAAKEIETINVAITGTMNKNRFNILDMNGKVKKIRLKTKLDSSNAMVDTVHPKWKIDTDVVEIPSATPISVTISPNEMKDISANFNVNQLTKHMSSINDLLANYKDDKIKAKLDDSFIGLNERNSFVDDFDFLPPAEYALSPVEWRRIMFMDFFDHFSSKMLQVLNDPNMTFTIFGDPLVVRKITPSDYAYVAPANIGPVTLNYTQTVAQLKDKRVYNFIGSDKMRNTNELVIIINPHNSEKIIYRIYDYQLYVSNEIRSIVNPALPNVYAFERWQFVEYMPVQGRISISHINGLANKD